MSLAYRLRLLYFKFFFLFSLFFFVFFRPDGGVLTYMVVGQDVDHVATRTLLYSLRFAFLYPQLSLSF
jgi:hypothetical protein